MGRIHQLPYKAGGLAAIVTGVVSYAAGIETSTIYLRMAIMMLVFFILGLYIRKTVIDIEKEVQEKKEEELRAEENEILRKRAGEQSASADMKNNILKSPAARENISQEQKIHKLDLTAGGSVDDFQPLVLSKAVSTKAKE